MAKETKGLLYTKSYPTKKGTMFKKYLFKSEKGHTYAVNLSKDLSALIDYEKWDFPQVVSMLDEDYFIKRTTYTNKDGEIRDSFKMIITNIRSHEKGKFESIHLEDIED